MLIIKFGYCFVGLSTYSEDHTHMNEKPEWEKPKLLDRVLEASREIKPEGLSEYKTHDAPLLSLYWRCVSVYGAILLLLDQRYGEEALSLARSLFTDSMRLLQIAEAGDARSSLSLGWLNNSYEEMKGLFHKARQLGLDPDPSDALNYIAEQQLKLQNYMRRNNVSKLDKFRSPEDAAKRYHRQEDYWWYFLAHEMVHGSDAAFVFRREKIRANTFELFNQSPNPEFLIKVGVFAGKSMLDAMYSVSSVFQWDLPPDYDNLKLKIESMS